MERGSRRARLLGTAWPAWVGKRGLAISFRIWISDFGNLVQGARETCQVSWAVF